MKTTKNFLLVIFLVGLVSAPLSAFALTPKTDNFCTKLPTVSDQLTSKLNELETQRAANAKEILSKMDERQKQKSDQTKEIRDDIQAKLDKGVVELENDNPTSTQKTFIATFKNAVKTALAERKTAVDQANQTFKTSQRQLVLDRQNALKTAAANLKAALAKALTDAKSACDAGTAPDKVKAQFIASVKAAKDKFHQDMQGIDKIGPQIKNLVQVRNKAIRDANEAFKTKLQKARQDLKTALATGKAAKDTDSNIDKSSD